MRDEPYEVLLPAKITLERGPDGRVCLSGVQGKNSWRCWENSPDFALQVSDWDCAYTAKLLQIEHDLDASCTCTSCSGARQVQESLLNSLTEAAEGD